jgi:hypothetical protein
MASWEEDKVGLAMAVSLGAIAGVSLGVAARAPEGAVALLGLVGGAAGGGIRHLLYKRGRSFSKGESVVLTQQYVDQSPMPNVAKGPATHAAGEAFTVLYWEPGMDHVAVLDKKGVALVLPSKLLIQPGGSS